jgi:hypothetical protein
MTARNEGPETSVGAVAALELPSNFEGAVVAMDEECELDEATQTIRCRLCSVDFEPPPNRGVSARVTLRPTAPGSLTFRSQLTAISADPDGSDNEDQVTVKVSGIPFPIFRRGDANDDGRTDISDGVRILNFLFVGGAVVLCPDAADANDDQAVNISDPSFIFSFLFLGGPVPPAPGPSPNPCCSDPTPDDLGSCRYNSC